VVLTAQITAAAPVCSHFTVMKRVYLSVYGYCVLEIGLEFVSSDSQCSQRFYILGNSATGWITLFRCSWSTYRDIFRFTKRRNLHITIKPNSSEWSGSCMSSFPVPVFVIDPLHLFVHPDSSQNPGSQLAWISSFDGPILTFEHNGVSLVRPGSFLMDRSLKIDQSYLVPSTL
jgi:hypothetical protein